MSGQFAGWDRSLLLRWITITSTITSTTKQGRSTAMELITADEKKQIEAKLEQLKAKRGDITKEIAEARAQGDLSENAGYHAAREKQGLNEADIRRLETRLATAKVADTSDVPKDMVFLGAVVKLRDTASERE